MPDQTIDEHIQSALTLLVNQQPQTKQAALDQQLRKHQALIRKAHAKGYTTKHIATVLKNAGLDASIDAIRRALQRIIKPAAKSKTTSKEPSP